MFSWKISTDEIGLTYEITTAVHGLEAYQSHKCDYHRNRVSHNTFPVDVFLFQNENVHRGCYDEKNHWND